MENPPLQSIPCMSPQAVAKRLLVVNGWTNCEYSDPYRHKLTALRVMLAEFLNKATSACVCPNLKTILYS